MSPKKRHERGRETWRVHHQTNTEKEPSEQPEKPTQPRRSKRHDWMWRQQNQRRNGRRSPTPRTPRQTGPPAASHGNDLQTAPNPHRRCRPHGRPRTQNTASGVAPAWPEASNRRSCLPADGTLSLSGTSLSRCTSCSRAPCMDLVPSCGRGCRFQERGRMHQNTMHGPREGSFDAAGRTLHSPCS